MNIEPILATELDWQHRVFPSTNNGAVTVASVGAQGWSVLDGDLLLPALVVKESALDHNIRLMSSFCRRHAISLCPHGKTPMSPQVLQRQLAAGAWGVSVASVSQARVFRSFGVRRILIANEVVDHAAIEWIANELARASGFEILCLVDSVAGVDRLTRILEAVHLGRRLPVLLEWGVDGGRAGVRTVEDATRVAEAVLHSPCLQLAGVEGYEGAVPGDSFEERVAGVGEYVKQVRVIAEHLDVLGAFAGLDEVIISVGGSLFVDVIARELCGAWRLKRPVRVVLRAGSYAFHDTDLMELHGALGGRSGGADRLQPALELWATVLSRPEPTRVIVGFGKRDVSYDISLPVPFGWSRDSEIIGFEGEASVAILNDQHAFVSIDSDCEIDVGDVVGLAVSHPCTALDKWKMLPVVDDDYNVTGAIATYF